MKLNMQIIKAFSKAAQKALQHKAMKVASQALWPLRNPPIFLLGETDRQAVRRMRVLLSEYQRVYTRPEMLDLPTLAMFASVPLTGCIYVHGESAAEADRREAELEIGGIYADYCCPN